MGVLVLLPMIPGVMGALYPLGNAPWMYATPMLGPYVLLTNVLGGQSPSMNAFLTSAGISAGRGGHPGSDHLDPVRERKDHLWPNKTVQTPPLSRRGFARPRAPGRRRGRHHVPAMRRIARSGQGQGLHQVPEVRVQVRLQRVVRRAGCSQTDLHRITRCAPQQFPPVSADSRNKVSQQSPLMPFEGGRVLRHLPGGQDAQPRVSPGLVLAHLRAVLRAEGKTLQPVGRSEVSLPEPRACASLRRAPQRHPPSRRSHHADRRDRHGQDDAHSLGAPASRSTHVQRVRARSVRLARRPVEDAARGLRRGVDRRPETRQPERRVAPGSELPALRVPGLARPAAGLRGVDHRRGAEPAAAAARRGSESCPTSRAARSCCRSCSWVSPNCARI